MASLKFRIFIHSIIFIISFFLGFIFIGSILLLIFNILSMYSLILFIPIWIIIILLERELIWTILFLLQDEPFKELSKTSGKHEKLLENYLNSIKKTRKRD